MPAPPMPSAGQLLQSERLKQQRTVIDIADATRINARYIEALERDDVSQLPGVFFYKAFIRQYAKALELNEAETERILRASVSVNEPDPVPVFSQHYENAATGEPARWTPPVGVAIGLLVAVIAAGAGLFALWQKSQHQPEVVQTNPTPPPTQTVSPSPQPSQQPAAIATSPAKPEPENPSGGTPATVTPGPVATSPAGTSPAAPPANPVEEQSPETSLDLVATEPTWVQLSSNGKMVYIGILDPSTPRQFRVAENARLLTGNAGGLEIRVNGKAIGSIGPKGQVRTVVFSGGSFQVAPPKPKPQPTTTPPTTGGNI